MAEEQKKSKLTSFVKGIIVAIFALLCGCCLGIMTCIIVILTPILWLILFLVETPYFSDLVEGLAWLKCEAPSWVPIVGNDEGEDAESCKLKEIIDEAEKQGLDDEIKGQFDCSIFPADLWYFCSDSLKLADDSPIPQDKQYLLAVWRAAGEVFDVPWQLLAALHATNTNFGEENCTNDNDDDKRKGGGHYDFSEEEWSEFKVDAGEERKEDYDDGDVKCGRHDPDNDKKGVEKHYNKIKSLEEVNEYLDDPEDSFGEGNDADPLDVVDATYTMARMLKHYGAAGSTWDAPEDYTGGLDNGCTDTIFSRDGTIYSHSGQVGFNSLLPTTPEFDAYYSYWSRKVPIKIKTLPKNMEAWVDKYGALPDKLQPGEIRYSGPGQEKRDVFLTPLEFKKMTNLVGTALGLPPRLLDREIPGSGGRTIRKNMTALATAESGLNYTVIQYTTTADVNSASYATWSRGMFQFIPASFEPSRVPGYDNIYHPMDNMLAAMNRMMHMTSVKATAGADKVSFDGKFYGWWPRGGGWNPGNFTNPYIEGESNDDDVDRPYEGIPIQVDKNANPMTHAVWQNWGTPKNHTSCYIATTWTWYSAILGVGYSSSGGGGGDFGGGDPNSPPGSFIWPTKTHTVTSPYGQRWGRLHAGYDIGSPEGEQIVASASGKVTADPLMPDPGGYGCTVYIAHNGNFFTRYAHVLRSTAEVKVGDEVAQGEPIVKSGGLTKAAAENCKGSSQGAHLHFEIRKGAEAVDPKNYLP